MRVLKIALVMSTVVGAAACQREAQVPAASSAQLTWLDSLIAQPAAQPAVAATPVELGATALPQPAPAPLYDSDVKAAMTQTAAKPTVTRRSSSSSSYRSSSSTRRASRSSSGGGYYSNRTAPVRQPRVVTVKHTKRDAAIGAGAGAVIGAVAGGREHRVRGAVIGAVLGGVAGAVIGNNVDVSRRVEY